MKFEAVNNPREEDGGFGPVSCDKCGAKTSAYLRINCATIIDLCSGCLYEGLDIIGKTILADCIKKAKEQGKC